MTPLVTTQETSKPREPKALDMCQALPLSEEEEQEVQEIFLEVRLQEERNFWEDERCNQQVIQEEWIAGDVQRYIQQVYLQYQVQMRASESLRHR